MLIFGKNFYSLKKLFLFITFLILLSSSRADFISLIQADKCETIIEMYIEEDRIRVTFEIGLNDLVYFAELVPKEMLPPEMQNMDRQQMMNSFFTQRFVLRADGKIIKGNIVKQEMMPRVYRASLYTGVVDTTANVSPYVLFTEIEYPLNKLPKVITISPPIEEGYQATLANIGFIAYHKNIPVNDLRYLGTTETLRMDWTDPWYTKFDNRNLKRHHSSSLLSFLYIDPYEVRHEVLVRIKDLDYWMDLGYDIDDKIPVDEQGNVKDKVAQFLKTKNRVTIDGREVEPIVDRVHWVKWSLSGIQIMEVPEQLDYSSAVIGVIFAYPHDSIAEEAIINWDMFNDRITVVPNVATDPVGPMPYNLQPDDNLLVWKNYMKKYKLPTITEATMVPLKLNLLQILAILILIVGLVVVIVNRKKANGLVVLLLAAVLFMSGFMFSYKVEIPFVKQTSFSKPEASALVSQLLKNTYRAFDFREESDIYDKLAVSNDGELLTEVYIQTKKGMVLENQGGLQVKVKDVELLELKELDAPDEGLAYEVKWIVNGDVGHWGHIHRRTNQYLSILRIKPVDGIWKLYDIEIIEEKRL